jgi:hypothetical protein
LNPVYIPANDYNNYTFPYIGEASINEIIQAANEIHQRNTTADTVMETVP